METFVILLVMMTSSVNEISFPNLNDLYVISLVKISKLMRIELKINVSVSMFSNNSDFIIDSMVLLELDISKQN
jgi:hypothetical protein